MLHLQGNSLKGYRWVLSLPLLDAQDLAKSRLAGLPREQGPGTVAGGPGQLGVGDGAGVPREGRKAEWEWGATRGRELGVGSQEQLEGGGGWRRGGCHGQA